MSAPPPAIRDCFTYDPETGAFMRCGRDGRRDVLHKRTGYCRVFFMGRNYQAHRLAWFFVHGCWPAADIDHKNCVRSDNRLSNLRLSDGTQNRANSRKRARALPKGVSFHKEAGRFQARIGSRGKHYFLGLFDTPDAAQAAYMKAAVELFGEYARAA